jgi:UDP-glucose 4-epimerase
VKHLLIASTSSMYGANTEMPYTETHKADIQICFYAATKKANEAMAYLQSALAIQPDGFGCRVNGQGGPETSNNTGQLHEPKDQDTAFFYPVPQQCQTGAWHLCRNPST